MATAIQSDLLTRAEAAAYLSIRPQTLAVWACNGRYPLPIVRVGRSVRYRRRDLDAFIESRTVGGDLVKDVRREFSESENCEAGKGTGNGQRRTGKDGKSYPPTRTRKPPAFTCPNCGGTEADEDGDCVKCHEPPRRRKAAARLSIKHAPT
jgi:excisionase family DNA binding protein